MTNTAAWIPVQSNFVLCTTQGGFCLLIQREAAAFLEGTLLGHLASVSLMEIIGTDSSREGVIWAHNSKKIQATVVWLRFIRVEHCGC